MGSIKTPFVCKSAEFDESKHPRDNSGEFTAGGSGAKMNVPERVKDALQSLIRQGNLADKHVARLITRHSLTEQEQESVKAAIDDAKKKRHARIQDANEKQKETQKNITKVVSWLDSEFGEPSMSGQSFAKYYTVGNHRIRVADHAPIHARSNSRINVVTGGDADQSYFHTDTTVIDARDRNHEDVIADIQAAIAKLPGNKSLNAPSAEYRTKSLRSPFTRKSSQWDENKHARDAGKFSSQPGAGAAPKQGPAQGSTQAAPDKTPQYVSQLKEKFGEQALAKVTAMKAKVAGDPAKVAALEKIEAALQPPQVESLESGRATTQPGVNSIVSPFGKSKQIDPVKTWSDRAKEMPGKMLDAAKAKVKTKFSQLETRYGRKTAVAIMVAGIAGLPLPVPGSSFITAAPVVAVAEMVRYFKGDSKTLNDADIDVEALGKQFIQSLVAEFEKEQGGGKSLSAIMTTKAIASPFGGKA